MSAWLAKMRDWLGRDAVMSAAQRQRLATWRALPMANLRQSLSEARVVVVDVETTGLAINADRLIAIGAVVIEAGRIDLTQSFEVVLRQDSVSSHENILIHGIGGTAQRDGVAPVDALLDFLAFLGRSPLVAFHAAFDQAMINRAIREELGFRFKHPWLDLAYVMPALRPDLNRCHALDDWTAHFKIDNFARHSALADALATAQLFLVATRLAREDEGSYQALQAIEAAQHWFSTR